MVAMTVLKRLKKSSTAHTSSMARVAITSRLMLGSSLCTLALSACQTLPTTPKTQTQMPQADQRGNTVVYDTEYNTGGDPRAPSTAPAQYPNSNETSDAQNPLTQPTQIIPQTQPATPEVPVITTPPDVMINEPSGIPSREDYIINQPQLPSHSDLLERARQNSKQQNRQTAANQTDLPAFRNLMQNGTRQLQAGDVNAAESSFTRAQRLAPRSSAVYFYLSQVALKKNQPRKAEAMARRGLSVSNDANRRRALWQLILKSGQAQNNARVVREAQQALR